MPLSGRAKIAIRKPVAGEASRCRRDHDTARWRLGLQPRRQVGGLTDHGVGLAAADLANHDQPRGDADPRAQRLRCAAQRAHFPGYLETGADRPFGIVLVSVG